MRAYERKNDLPMMETSEGVVLFHPHVPKSAKRRVNEVLDGRWIGQGPRVDQFESFFMHKFALPGCALAVNSGTSALHLAYLAAGLKKGDEVLTTVFTCTATNIPLLYIGCDIKFVDIDPKTLNISVEDLKRKVSNRTKAIVIVHYGGLPCDMSEIQRIAEEVGAVIIEDAAHALGAQYDGDYIGSLSEFTMFSFQAIKHLTTGDGGMLVARDHALSPLLKRLRWFGIDRTDKQKGVWENDIREVGFKYQMTDISASIGLAGLEEFDSTLEIRKELYSRYVQGLAGFSDVQIVSDSDPRKVHAAWLFTILVERRMDLQRKLRELGIESGQTHYRNDRYSIFEQARGDFPGMDFADDRYLVLPLHTKVSISDVDRIVQQIRSGW